MVNKKFKKFTILADCPPPINEKSLRDYADSGIDTYVLTEDYFKYEDSPCDYVKKLEILNSSGLNVFVRGLDHKVFPGYFDKFKDFDFSNFKCVKGFYVIDEPNAAKFLPMAENYVKFFNDKYSDLFWHINLFPSYATDEQLGTCGENGKSAHEVYVQKYLEIVSRKVDGEKDIGFDHYPLRFRNGKKTMTDGWLRDLYVFAKAAHSENIRFSVCIQCFTDFDAWRDLETSDEVMFQVFVSLAFGADIFEFFIYNSVYTEKEGSFLGMVKEGEKTKYYDFVKRATSYLRFIEKRYFTFDWKGINFVCGRKSGELNEKLFNGIKGKTTDLPEEIESLTSTGDILTGIFENATEKGLLIVNFNDPAFNLEADTEIVMAESEENITVIDQTGENKIKSGKNPINIKLAAGSGAFVIFSSSKNKK